MRYVKYSKIITFGLFSLTLSFLQCNKETSFQLYPCIKGQVTDATTKEPIDSATVRLWIDGLGSDTLTYLTDSNGAYSSERINNWFDKLLTVEASRKYPAPGKEHYGPVRTDVSPEILNAKDSITSDTLYINIELRPAFDIASLHSVMPKRLDFLDSQYTSYFIIINEGSNLLYWKIGENNTAWMSLYWIRIYNATDLNHLKKGGYVKYQVNISKQLTPGTYDSSILIITDQGNTEIPVHVTIE
jgi:hypothetical protein